MGEILLLLREEDDDEEEGVRARSIMVLGREEEEPVTESVGLPPLEGLMSGGVVPVEGMLLLVSVAAVLLLLSTT